MLSKKNDNADLSVGRVVEEKTGGDKGSQRKKGRNTSGLTQTYGREIF